MAVPRKVVSQEIQWLLSEQKRLICPATSSWCEFTIIVMSIRNGSNDTSILALSSAFVIAAVGNNYENRDHCPSKES